MSCNTYKYEQISYKVMSIIVSHLPLDISETVRDRGLVPKDHQYEVTYGELNGHVTDNVT